MEEENKGKPFTEPVSIEAQKQLVKLMNDEPTLLKLKGTEWEIHALKPGTQWLICKEAVDIVKKEKMTMGDVLKAFSSNMEKVVRVITLALLNDKKKIYGEEYKTVYDLLMWSDIDMTDWAKILFEIISMVNVGFFFQITDAIQTIRLMSLERKMTQNEQRQLLQEQNGGR